MPVIFVNYYLKKKKLVYFIFPYHMLVALFQLERAADEYHFLPSY